jgi:hypothetical protein
MWRVDRVKGVKGIDISVERERSNAMSGDIKLQRADEVHSRLVAKAK